MSTKKMTVGVIGVAAAGLVLVGVAVPAVISASSGSSFHASDASARTSSLPIASTPASDDVSRAVLLQRVSDILEFHTSAAAPVTVGDRVSTGRTGSGATSSWSNTANPTASSTWPTTTSTVSSNSSGTDTWPGTEASTGSGPSAGSTPSAGAGSTGTGGGSTGTGSTGTGTAGTGTGTGATGSTGTGSTTGLPAVVAATGTTVGNVVTGLTGALGLGGN